MNICGLKIDNMLWLIQVYFTFHNNLEVQTRLHEQDHFTHNNKRNIDVIIVESVDTVHKENKNEILVNPESNPYYVKDSYQEHDNAQSISLEDSIDKIKATNNIYYE